MTTNLHDKMLAAIDAYFSASDAVEEEVAENLLLDVRDEINKYKRAAESLNEGLRLDDWDKIGCVNHDCDKCKALAEQPAQQEPVAKVYRHGKASNGEPWHGVHWFDEGVNMPDGTLLYTAAQPAREWVGLTKEDKAEIVAATERDDRGYVMALVEAKLKEKNT